MVEATEDLQIDSIGPMQVAAPESTSDLKAVIASGFEQGGPIFPFGGRTRAHFGLPPRQPGLAVDMRRLQDVVDYPSRDMTITVQSGITIAKLASVLAENGQELPVDLPAPEQSTLGGAIATNSSGPRRFSCGTLRDYVLGMTVIDDAGQETKSGGRVVKNVAGYDLCKLQIGALGTLGVVAQVTLKVCPLPEDRAFVALSFAPESLSDLLDLLHSTKTRPTSITAIGGSLRSRLLQAKRDNREILLVVGFQESKKSVESQLGCLEAESKEIASILKRWKGASAGTCLAALTSYPYEDQGVVTIKATMAPSAVADYLGWLQSSSVWAGIQAEVGNGVVYSHLAPDIGFDEAQRVVGDALEKACNRHGNAVLLRCPVEWKGRLPIWGKLRDDAWLMRRVKEKLDPKARFNPGRFVAGI